jgi:hypothetical protein
MLSGEQSVVVGIAVWARNQLEIMVVVVVL